MIDIDGCCLFCLKIMKQLNMLMKIDIYNYNVLI